MHLSATEQDDPAFVELVSRILHGAIQCYKPHQLYVIHLDHWFDHKWTCYAGRRGYCCNVWLDSLRPPPFSPNRVTSQLSYERGTAEPFEFDRTKAPDLHIWRSSATNSHQRLEAITPSGLYLWYSGGTLKLDRESVMAYSVQEGQNLGRYASLLRRAEWKIESTKGISRRELRFLLRSPPL